MPLEEIAVGALMLDVENPRLGIVASTRDAMRAIIHDDKAGAVNLAEDIARRGLDDAETFVVMPATEEEGLFVVLDGNRRATALRLLTEPAIGNDLLTRKQASRVKAASDRLKKHPIRTVLAKVFQTRTEAEETLRTRHTSRQDGVSRKRWSAIQERRFEERRAGGTRTMEMQAIDFVVGSGVLSDEVIDKIAAGKITVSTVKRIIADPYVREKIGLVRGKKGELQMAYPAEEVARPLGRIVTDLVNDEIDVNDVYYSSQRKKYIDGFAARDRPKKSARLPAPLPLSSVAATGEESESASSTRPRPRKTKSPFGEALIPSACQLEISESRIHNIAYELRHLRVAKFPNAVAVLLRVFFELTVDWYLLNRNLMPKDVLERPGVKLAGKVTTIVSHIETNGLMTKSELAALRRVSSGQHFVAESITTLHGYVHSHHFEPIERDIRAAWKQLQPFFEHAWAPAPRAADTTGKAEKGQGRRR